MTGEFIVILLLILLNGVFAMGEMAIVSARKARLQRLARTSAGARKALELSENPTSLLSTVQIGITVVGVMSGALGGGAISVQIADQLADTPLAPYATDIGFAVTVVGIAYLSLVIGELVPKRLGLTYPERISALLATPMSIIAKVATPAIWVLSRSTEIVLKLIPGKQAGESPVTDEEIKLMMQEGADSGHFHAAEKAIVDQTLRLGDRRVSALMTPRTQLEVLDLADSHEELLQIIRISGHSRFPVVEGDPNNIVGVVQVRDLLTAHLAGQSVDVRAAMRSPLFIPDTAPALKAMELFKQSGSSIALIVDEYGDLQGLVTLNDLLEALVGDIGTIDPNEEPEWVQREDGSYLVDGMMPLDELRDLLALNDLPGAGESQAQTLGGYMMALLKRIPEPADVAEIDGGWRFEVVDMDGRRVDKVLISPPVAEDAIGKDI